MLTSIYLIIYWYNTLFTGNNITGWLKWKEIIKILNLVEVIILVKEIVLDQLLKEMKLMNLNLEKMSVINLPKLNGNELKFPFYFVRNILINVIITPTKLLTNVILYCLCLIASGNNSYIEI